MKTTDLLQIIIVPVITGILIWNGWNIFAAVLIGLLSSFIPITPMALYKGYRAFRKEWNDPKYK
ncbi:MAG: hypothetical protein ACRC62_10025 [Microcoleus sp.]